MKSHLFSIVDLAHTEDFTKDIKLLFDLDPPTLAGLPEYALESLEAPTRAEAYNVYERAAEKLGVPQSLLTPAIRVARFFLRECSPKGDAESDAPQVLVDDLKELFGLPEDKTEPVRSMLRDIKAKAMGGTVQLALLRKEHYESFLPILASVAVAADLRAIFDEQYEYDKDVSEFSPRFMGTIPVGIMELTLEHGRSKSKKVFFQVDKRTLQILLDYVLALQKQIDIAEKRITTKES